MSSLLCLLAMIGACHHLVFSSEIQLQIKSSSYEDLRKTALEITATTATSQVLGQSQIVKFETVWTNEGNGFHPSTGIFRTPKSGLYHIAGTVMSSHGHYLHVHLYRNDEKIVGLYTGSGFHTGTINMILKLKKGDRIYLQHTPGRPTETFYSDANTYGAFSAFWISQ